MFLKLHNVHKHFGKTVLFQNVNLEFSKCGLYFLTGESGSGKTTLLNIIAGYERADGERILSDDISIACIFQSYELIEELTVRDNLYLYQNVFREGETEHSKEIIEELGLEEVLEHYPKELSGGQKQRVGIARALLLHPNMIICDEPTEALDVENKEKVLQLLKKLSRHMIVLIASHEKAILEEYYDYHYEILDKNVICTEKRVAGEECIASKMNEVLDLKKVDVYLWKMIRKITVMYSAIFGVVLLVTMIFAQVNHQIFKERKQISSLNYDVVYLSDEGGDNETLEKELPLDSIKNSYLQIPFSFWFYEGKAYKPKIFPYISNRSNVEILGKARLNENEILINGYAADKMKETLKCSSQDLLGRKLELSYIIEKEEYPIIFEIAGIVQEEDVNGRMNLYYNYDYLKQFLQEKEYFTGMSQYDYLCKYHREYALEVNEKTVCRTFYDQLTSIDMKVYHSIFSNMDELGKQKEIYQLVFQVIQIILFIFTILYVLFYSLKDTRKNRKNLSILISMHIPMRVIKKRYFIKKVITMTIAMVLVMGEIVSYTLISRENTMFFQYICYVIGVYVFYIITLIISLKSFRISKVSDILKDSKDN